MSTCIKCHEEYPHMISMCAKCYREVQKDSIVDKRAAKIGATFVANYHEIRATIKGWQNKCLQMESECLKTIREGGTATPDPWAIEASAFQRVIDLLDNPNKGDADK